MSTGAADRIVSDTVEAARSVFGDEIEAIYTLGSLAHGGFAPLVSDIDVAIILASTTPDTADRIGRTHDLVVTKASNPLSERLSVFWGDWHAVRTGEGNHYRLGPVDRLDLLDSGHLLVGSDGREPSVRPSAAELILMSADLILSKFTDEYLDGLKDTQELVAGGPRAATKAVLFPVRFMYTLRTGGIGLNDRSAHWYASEGLPGSALALKALEWRNEGISDPDSAIQILDADLATLHAECLTGFAERLNAHGATPRATALTERTHAYLATTPDGR